MAAIGVRLRAMLAARGAIISTMATRPITVRPPPHGFGLSGLFNR